MDPRFLQVGLGGDIAGGDGDACPRPDTCEPNLCACVADGGRGFDCAPELHAVCNGVTGADGKIFTIGGCVDDVTYYEQTYCPFAECIVNGGTFESCDCAFYKDFCDVYKDDPDYGIQVYEKTAMHCAIDACCKTKVDDVGRGMCLEAAPTSMPSAMPTGPTVSPTTGSPTVTPDPTKANTSPGTRPTPPDKPNTDALPTPTISSPGGTPPTNTPPTLDAPPPAPPATTPAEPPSSGHSLILGIMGTTTSLVATTLVWSLGLN